MWRRAVPLRLRRGHCPSRAVSSHQAAATGSSDPDLLFTLPDLSAEERQFVASQVRLAGELPTEGIMLQDPESVMSVIRKKYFPGTGLQPMMTLSLKLSLSQSVEMYRRCDALRHFGIRPREVAADTAAILRYPMRSLVRDLQDRELVGTPSLVTVTRAKRFRPLRAQAARNRVTELQDCIEKLGLGCGRPLGPVLAAGNREETTFADLDERLVRAFFRLRHAPEAALSRFEAWKRPKKDTHPVLVPDAKNFVRNTYLFCHVLGLGMESQSSIARARSWCPLLVLISLNDLDAALNLGGGARPSPEQLKELAGTLCANYHTLAGGTASARKRLLLDLGLSPDEANHALLAPKALAVQFPGKGKFKLDYSDPGFVPEMRRRLELFRANQDLLGMPDGAEMVIFLSRWRLFLEQVEGILKTGQMSRVILAWPSYPGRLTQVIKKHPMHPAVRYLASFFQLDAEDAEARQALAWDLFPSNTSIQIPFPRIKNSLEFLYEECGFGKDEIRSALPLLLHPKEAIESALAGIDPVEARELAGLRRTLPACLYLLEREDNFSTDAILMPNNLDFTKEMYQELEEQTGYVREEPKAVPVPAPAPAPVPAPVPVPVSPAQPVPWSAAVPVSAPALDFRASAFRADTDAVASLLRG